jgi:hypothetical protein
VVFWHVNVPSPDAAAGDLPWHPLEGSIDAELQPDFIAAIPDFPPELGVACTIKSKG